MHLGTFFATLFAEFNHFLFKKLSAVGIAIAVKIGAHVEKMIQGLSDGLITQLITPFVRGQDWQEFVIPKF